VPERVLAKLPAGYQAYEDHWLVRHIQRLKLNTKYPEIADELERLIDKVEYIVKAANMQNRAGNLVPADFAEFTVFMDATGVGKPVADEIRKRGIKITPVYFNYGDQRTPFRETPDDLELSIRLGKSYMVSRLQVLLQTSRIHLPQRSEEARVMAQELLDYQIRVSDKGTETAGAFKVGTHDDLATSLGLAVNETPIYMNATLVTPAFQAVPVGAPALTSNLPDLRRSSLDPFISDNWDDGDHALDKFRR